ncbi:MAG: hypothetical protein WD672_05945, partial [Woeseia sp.]
WRSRETHDSANRNEIAAALRASQRQCDVATSHHPRHREERSDVAISHHPRHREERSDVAISHG